MVMVVVMMVAVMVPPMMAMADSSRAGIGGGCTVAVLHFGGCGREQGGGEDGRDDGGEDFFVHGLAWLDLIC